jgi:hypothetical protein
LRRSPGCAGRPLANSKGRTSEANSTAEGDPARQHPSGQLDPSQCNGRRLVQKALPLDLATRQPASTNRLRLCPRARCPARKSSRRARGGPTGGVFVTGTMRRRPRDRLPAGAQQQLADGGPSSLDGRALPLLSSPQTPISLTHTHTPPSHTSTQHHAVCPRPAHRPQGLRPALARRPDRLRHRRRPRHVSRPSRHLSPPNSFGRGHRVVPGLDPLSDAARARIAQAVVLRLAERAPSTPCASSSARPRLDKPGPPC